MSSLLPLLLVSLLTWTTDGDGSNDAICGAEGCLDEFTESLQDQIVAPTGELNVHSQL